MCFSVFKFFSSSPRHWNTGFVFSEVSLTPWGEGVSLPLVGQPFSDGVTIKIPYGVDVLLYWHVSHPILSFLNGLVQTEFDFIVRSVYTGLRRWMLAVAVITVNDYPFLAFSDLTCHLEDTGI